MNFLHPALLFGAIGIGLPILAHLLNRYEVKRTDWAAMQFLNRNVRVRSRQLKLRDILLLILRCLALLFLVLALANPSSPNPGSLGQSIGQQRGGVVLAIDASYSMQHSDGKATRFDRALEHARTILSKIHPGAPVSLVLLGTEHEVIARSLAYEPAHFEELLQGLSTRPESLRLDNVPPLLGELAEEMEAPHKSIFLITDLQRQDWEGQPAWLETAFDGLGETTPTVMVVVPGGSENLAITDLELVSGVLRKGTIARYQAKVRNFGATPATNVRVKGLADNAIVDTKTIPVIRPGSSATVSLFVHFHNAGAVKVTAALEEDPLPADNFRHTVAVVREEIRVLCVEGSQGEGSSSGFINTALQARGDSAETENFELQTIPWTNLPGKDLDPFDVIVLQDVPDIADEHAAALEGFVREGKGLVWFPGNKLDAAAWNQHSSGDGIPLLPAILGEPVATSDALGVGRPLDPSIPDHAVCRPLHSLPEDLLGETQFRKVLQVEPAASSSTVLSLAGTSMPLLLEHSLGRGHVFLFTTSADPGWNNLALTPVFPMLLQQMVTYLTAREFERPGRVGLPLSLAYEDRPDASEAVFETPSGENITVPVQEHRKQYVALLDQARETGFYMARVSLQAPGLPIAVNIDTRESDVASLDNDAISAALGNSGILLALTEPELVDTFTQLEPRWSYWKFCLLAGLGLLVVEGLLATGMRNRPANPQPEGAQ